MKKHNSAIMQMMMGQRGNFDELKLSDEYKKATHDLVDKIEEFQKQIADNPKLLEMFNELQNAHVSENTIFANDVYREAFAFGLAMGQEVFDN
ncbi:MAG: hypothetical protein K2I23_04955 [Clostridia bacterium]|nr:hypothetical protein [Clostridia bacterium]